MLGTKSFTVRPVCQNQPDRPLNLQSPYSYVLVPVLVLLRLDDDDDDNNNTTSQTPVQKARDGPETPTEALLYLP